MKKIFLCFIVLFLNIPLFSMSAIESFFTSQKIKVATTTQIAEILRTKDGILDTFKVEGGIDVELIEESDIANFTERIENDTLDVDIVLGIDDMLIDDVRSKFADAKIFEYAFLTFYMDPNAKIPTPTSLFDLQNEEYTGKIAITDPRLSTIGHELLEWTISVYGLDGAYTWWQNVLKNSNIANNSWYSAYSSFAKKDTCIILSYTTSPIIKSNNEIVPLNFREGSITTDEYVCIMANSNNKIYAKKFFDYIIENSHIIAKQNSMYPVRGIDKMPTEYKWITNPVKIVTNSYQKNLDSDILKKWEPLLVK